MIIADPNPDQLPPLRLPVSSPRKSRVILDTNIANYAYRSVDGSVFRRIHHGLMIHLLAHWSHVEFAVSPLQTLELLGTGLP